MKIQVEQVSTQVKNGIKKVKFLPPIQIIRPTTVAGISVCISYSDRLPQPLRKLLSRIPPAYSLSAKLLPFSFEDPLFCSEYLLSMSSKRTPACRADMLIRSILGQRRSKSAVSNVQDRDISPNPEDFYIATINKCESPSDTMMHTHKAANSATEKVRSIRSLGTCEYTLPGSRVFATKGHCDAIHQNCQLEYPKA